MNSTSEKTSICLSTY